jgi:hypothetical protein
MKIVSRPAPKPEHKPGEFLLAREHRERLAKIEASMKRKRHKDKEGEI